MIQRTIINHRLNDTKKWISELEDKVMEITGTEQVKNMTVQETARTASCYERVTGRKSRGLQTEEIGCKCQTFFSLLSGMRKQTSDIFFPSLYKFKRRVLLKYCVVMTPGFTRS